MGHTTTWNELSINNSEVMKDLATEGVEVGHTALKLKRSFATLPRPSVGFFLLQPSKTIQHNNLIFDNDEEKSIKRFHLQKKTYFKNNQGSSCLRQHISFLETFTNFSIKLGHFE